MPKSPKTTSPAPVGPNGKPEAKTAAQKAALLVTCRYLGKTFYEGDTICYQGGEWICGPGGWTDNNKAC